MNKVNLLLQQLCSPILFIFVTNNYTVLLNYHDVPLCYSVI